MARVLPPTRRVALVAVLSAAAIGSSYVMYPLPNVKLMDVLVFATAFCFGFRSGVAVAGLTWLVYGSVNPYGSAGLPLLLVLIVGESAYAAFGAAAGRMFPVASFSLRRPPGGHVLLAAIGGVSALSYDLFTNAVSGLMAYPTLAPWDAVTLGLLTMNFPVPLGLMHQASNIVFFAAMGPPLIAALRRVSGRGVLE